VGQRLDITNLPSGMVLMEKYRVVKMLGLGGMGVVVACDHLELGSRVAIKFMLPELVSNEKVVKRFMIEARAATRIQSDHVARVLDVGRFKREGLPDDGVPFLVMEYLQGRDLSEWVRMGKKFPIDEAIEYIAQAAEALARAHRVAVIHRDIKPANLFLHERDEPMVTGRTSTPPPRRVIKVLDFGISKIMDEEPQEMGLTKTTTVLGSGLYMSPEQMRSAKNVDFRTDIYSLGVCLYELLTGTQPYTAETFSELCVKVNIDPPTPIRDYRPDVSNDLAAVIARAYAKDPDERWQTVQDFAAALLPFASAQSRPAIEQIQGITRHHSIPPPPAALSGQHTAVAAVTEVPEARQRGASGGIVIAALAVALLLGGVGLLFVKRPPAVFGEPTPSTGAEPAKPPPAPPPPAPATTTSATPTGTNVIDLDDVEAPPPATASVKATGGGKTPQPPPPPVDKPKPPPPPVKMCNCMTGDGLMERRPCPCP
jgi:serine/threonine-protein kinase